MTEPAPPGACAVLLDLDGTCADTAPDLAWALNQVLIAHGRPPCPFEAIRPHVSHGGRALIRFGFGLAPEHPDFESLRHTLLEIYRAHLSTRTRLFPGMVELLGALGARGIPWGIVTNKPAWLTEPLLHDLGLAGRAACIVSGDTTPHSKPHPGPILHACRLLQRDPGCCWYLGDAERDVTAGRAAGTRTLVALFGYLGAADRPHTWGADGLIEHPLELLGWIDG